MTKRKSSFLSFLCFCVALIVGLACGSSDETSVDSVAEESVTAFQLMRYYQSNEVSADAKYKNKIIKVRGQIRAIGKDILNTMYVALRAGGRYSIFTVQCMFSNKHKNQLASLRKGQWVTIKGKCTGKMGNVLLRGSILVSN